MGGTAQGAARLDDVRVRMGRALLAPEGTAAPAPAPAPRTVRFLEPSTEPAPRETGTAGSYADAYRASIDVYNSPGARGLVARVPGLEEHRQVVNDHVPGTAGQIAESSGASPPQ